jgi:hypothetical protein
VTLDPEIHDQLYSAMNILYRRAAEEAERRNIPLDGSWRFLVTVAVDHSDDRMSQTYRLVGWWDKVE